MSDAERSVLIVSPHFPPATTAGVHRARHMARRLPEFGWRPTVIRAAEEHYSESIDPGLGALVSPDLRQVRTAALPTGLLRAIGIGDIGLRAYPYIRRSLIRLIEEHRPDAVFITGSPYYPMLIAPHLKRTYGVPVVLDFQDPWVSAYSAGRPAFSKEGVVHRIGSVLEPKALRAADYVTSVSETQNDQLVERYPWLDRARMAAIPIGGEPEDFDALRAAPPANPQVSLEAGAINLSYVGSFLPRAGPLARTLFAALADLRAEAPDLAARLRLHFIGTSNQPDDRTTFRVLPIAKEAGVADLVREVPQRVPFLEALSLLATSDGLLLIGSDERHYTASKIYPALMSGTPYLSLFHAESSAHAILSAAGGGLACAFRDGTELATLKDALKAGLFDLATKPQAFGKPDPAAYAPFTARAVAGRYAEIFEGLARG